MNILFLTSRIPNPYSGASIRPFHLIKIFSEKYNHKVSLISFGSNVSDSDISKLNKQCQKFVLIPLKDESEKDVAIHTLLNLLSLNNTITKISSNNGIIDPTYYNQVGVQEIIDKFLENNEIDAVYSDSCMAGYVAKSKLPKIVEPLDIDHVNWFNYFINTRNPLLKFYWFTRYIQTLYRETQIFKKFDYCVLVTETDKTNIEKNLPNTKIIPNGVDIDYFYPMDIKSDELSLVFTGVLNGPKNVEAVLHFYYEIFPIIRTKFPKTLFYVVGKDPHPDILELSKDSSIVVTGFVEDLRPYVAKASIFICPHISGTGIKNKVLEAMAMGKPVVSTSIGALGIDAAYENIIIANNPREFANSVLELLSDSELRDKIGKNARKFIEDNFSWDKTANDINQLFQ